MSFKPADAEIDPPRDAYFHGTKGSFQVGDTLLPRKTHGANPTSAPLQPGAERLAAADDYVYVTRRYLLAWAYAHASGGDGPPVVLLVRPEGAVEPDPESSDHMHAYRCKSARVLVIDTKMPISAATAEKSWKRDLTDGPADR